MFFELQSDHSSCLRPIAADPFKENKSIENGMLIFEQLKYLAIIERLLLKVTLI